MNKESKLTNKHWVIMSPYMFSLELFGLILCGGLCIFFDTWLLPNSIYANANEIEKLKVYLLMNGLCAALPLTLMLTGYEFFGFCCICDDRIKFYSLARPPRTLFYSDIKYVGIDFGMLSVTRQFWIYFSKTELPYKYHHRINRVPFTKNTMRVQYNKKTYNILLETLPPKLSKQLNNGYSIFRTYHEED